MSENRTIQTFLKTVHPYATLPWDGLARVVAVDKTGAVRSTSQPAPIVASAVTIQRRAPAKRVPVAFDCDNGVCADLLKGACLAENGTLEGAQWCGPDATDVLAAATSEGG